MFTLWGVYFASTRQQDKKQTSTKISLVQEQAKKRSGLLRFFKIISSNLTHFCSTNRFHIQM